MNAHRHAPSAWRRFLEDELDKAEKSRARRTGDFDLDDSSELEGPLRDHPSRLRDALEVFQTHLLPVWREADRSALREQRWHRKLAGVTILSGTIAIVLAIFQVAISGHKSVTAINPYALYLEVPAVIAGSVAVLIGLWRRGDRKWLCERNRAERLRFLKFRSLGSDKLWQKEITAWKQEVIQAIELLSRPLDEQAVMKWSEKELARPERTFAGGRTADHADQVALKSYYELKRLQYQSRYFAKRSKQHLASAHPWRHLSRPVFFTSTGLVLIHFACELLERHHESTLINGIGIVALTLAAIIPVLGLGARVWLGAFEPHRSGILFACKRQTVEGLLQEISSPDNERHPWSGQVAQCEWFFENEHREWLRLMLETEWML